MTVISAICEGNFTCVENEVCVRPNECRCRHGYFGATCDMSEKKNILSLHFIHSSLFTLVEDYLLQTLFDLDLLTELCLESSIPYNN